MKISRRIVLAAAFIAVSALCVSAFVQVACAVTPPSVKERQKAQRHKEKEDKRKLGEQRHSGCTYGRDKVTGKCYEPKEDQLYRDPKTGKMKMKEIEKVNLPWN